MRISPQVVAATALLATSPATASSRDDEPFDWSSIQPSPDLRYRECYGGFWCARLELPLDWTREQDNRTVAIAVIKLAAVVPDDDAAFGGSIFTNPGGPGGSGVGFVRSSGRALQSMVDKPGVRHYELLSFDPRGVGRSEPAADCFPGDELARDAHVIETRGNGELDGSPRAVAYGLGLMDVYGRRCEAADAARGILAHMGTPSVARDMVAMVDAVDAWRRRRAAKGLPRPELARRGASRDVPRLQYIGFSYGTVLGNYFASMFPGRVGRVALDGVCNADDYANGPGWLANTVDTDKMAAAFFAGCHAAGPSACALARRGDASAAQLQRRFAAWLAGLDERPLGVLDASGTSVVVGAGDVRLALAAALSNPIPGFKPLASLLDEAMHGNTTALVGAILDSGLVPALQNACPVDGVPAAPVLKREATNAVVCGDGSDVGGRNAAWWRRYVAKQVHTSSVMGSYWATIRFACARWRSPANWVFRGPFTTPAPSHAADAPEPGRPAAPLLFLSNRLDPVTPLAAARAMAAQHPRAGLVVQEAMGHCTFQTAVSGCTRAALADYFHTGAVPAGEASCATECGPWDEGCRAFVAPEAPVQQSAASVLGSVASVLGSGARPLFRDMRFPLLI